VLPLLDLTKAPNITDWLTAVGTVGAAAAAVWLGLRDGFTRLRVTVEPTKSSTAKLYDFQDVWDVVTLRIVNRGRRAAYVTEFAWEVGWLSKDTHRVMTDTGTRMAIPIELQDGRAAAIPLVFADQPQAFRDAMLSTRLIDRLTPVAAVVRTSVGRAFRARFSRRARFLMRERSFYRTDPASSTKT
jgi:hypothetical protein